MAKESSQLVEVYVNGNLENVATVETPVDIDAPTAQFYQGKQCLLRSRVRGLRSVN